jgi:hypothetical protein
MKDNRIYDKIKNLTGKWDKNVGPFDSQARILIGSMLILLAPLQALGYVPIPLFSSIGATFAGTILVVEGLINRCVLYSILGIDRCPVDIREKESED